MGHCAAASWLGGEGGRDLRWRGVWLQIHAGAGAARPDRHSTPSAQAHLRRPGVRRRGLFIRPAAPQTEACTSPLHLLANGDCGWHHQLVFCASQDVARRAEADAARAREAAARVQLSEGEVLASLESFKGSHLLEPAVGTGGGAISNPMNDCRVVTLRVARSGLAVVERCAAPGRQCASCFSYSIPATATARESSCTTSGRPPRTLCHR
jgi:hypothetical protein